MAIEIQPIKPNESSPNVANLHAVLLSFGLTVDQAEVRQQRAGVSTLRLVRELQRRFNLVPDEDFVVDKKSAAALNKMLKTQPSDPQQAPEPPFFVEGIVSAGGRPLRGYVVAAFDQDLRRREELGRTTVDARGNYVIRYGLEQFARSEKGNADLVVEVYGPSGQTLFTSEVRFNAPQHSRIDVALDAQTTIAAESEYARLMREVAPLVQGEDLALDAIEESESHADVTFLASETGISRDEITAFAVAHRLQPLTKLDAELWYALIRARGVAASAAPGRDTLEDVARSTADDAASKSLGDVEEAVRRAIAGQVIDPRDDKGIDSWKTQFLDFTHFWGDKARTQTAQTIADAVDLGKKKRDVFTAVQAEGGTRAEIVERLRGRKELSDDDVAKIDAALHLHALTLGDAALVKSLKPGADAVRQAAKMSAADWQKAIESAKIAPPDFIAGADAQEQRRNYAQLLATRFEAELPSAAFAGRLSQTTKAPLANAQAVASFLDQNPKFDLKATNVDRYLASSKTKIEPGVAADLRAAQRTLHVAPNSAAALTLLADGLHSSQQIYRMGESQFAARYAGREGFTRQSAAETWQRSANKQAAMVKIIGELRDYQNAGDLWALGNLTIADDAFPNFSTLFGAADICECEDCRSIFSASAYFADIMMFLGGRVKAVAAGSVKDALLERRPDIGFLELTCENSNVPLPYIDLTCEVLEDRVAPWLLFTLPLSIEPSLAVGPATALQTPFKTAATNAVELSGDARIAAKDPAASPQWWIVRDTAATYLLAKTAGGFDVSLLRQTRGTAEELAAAPEYVNKEAYKTLRDAKRPLALPFDLFTEEVRAYLKYAGLQRSELMEVFRNGTTSASDLDVAAERIDIAHAEQDFIFTAHPELQATYWGSTASMTKVNVFLDRTGLEYADMLRLLSLKFINPAGAIRVNHLDNSCDTAQKELTSLDDNALDRIHRFLRLWRKLGWKMWELDLVINHPVIGSGGGIDDQFGRNLLPFRKLQEKLPSLSIEQLCAFYAPINTAAKFTEVFEKPEASLWEQMFLNKRLTNPIDDAFTLEMLVGPLQAMSPHVPSILAALRIRQKEFDVFTTITPRGLATPFVGSDLTVANVSTLFRHATLAKLLGVKAAEWGTLLFLVNADVFQNPAATVTFIESVDAVRASGFTIDQLNYALSGDPSLKSAEREKNVVLFLTTLRKALQGIAAANDPTAVAANDEALAAAIAAQLQTLGWPAETIQSLQAMFKGQLVSRAVAPGVPAGFTFPPAITTAIHIAYDGATHTFSFTGNMTGAEQSTLLTDASLAAVTGNADYQAAINDLHDAPILLIKLYRPIFRTPLATLPAALDFAKQLPKELAARIAYDAERRELVFTGVMTRAERDALQALLGDATYNAAVTALFQLPRTGVFPANELWLTPADLAAPLDTNLVANLTTAETRLADYVVRTLSRDQVVEQFAGALGVTQAVAELLLATPLFGSALLGEYTAPAFAGSANAITRALFPNPFDGYFWMHRAALVARTPAMTLADLRFVTNRHAETATLDFAALPATFNPASAAALDPLLRLAAFMKFHHTWSDANLAMTDMVERLIADAGYTSALFAADVETLTTWPQADVAWFTAAGNVDAAYPAAYQRIEAWKRLERAIAIAQLLNGAVSVIAAKLSVSVVPDDAPAAIKQMIRSRFDDKAWFDVSKPIQDALRDRKRESLVAYLLTQPMPADAPTHKWQNANDLFAYYLIDPEMTACQLTSRIVQASAAVQLYVQRCFMGLEPKVHVDVVDDDGWLQWNWMKYYRVWEANRRVFAYPENYVEPELRRDKSELFERFENELLQNELNRDNVESAFLHYVDGLNDISQLEVAGTYYQDSKRTFHVFGRTPGAEPRTYYYRQCIDDRRWTPWKKVEADIKSDYLVPLVADERLQLVWPEYVETTVPPPSSITVPNSGDTVHNDSQMKRMSIHLALSELRSGKWTPKKVSQDAVEAIEYASNEEFDKGHLLILPLDFTFIPNFPYLIEAIDLQRGNPRLFALAGCRGYPEALPDQLRLLPLLTRFQRDDLNLMKNAEQYQTEDNSLTPQVSFTMFQQILKQTPGLFRITYPHYISYFDRLLLFFFAAAAAAAPNTRFLATQSRRGFFVPLGTFYPFFYADALRTYFVRQELFSEGKVLYYSDTVALFDSIFDLIKKQDWPKLKELLEKNAELKYRFRLRFTNFYHPLVCLFGRKLNAGGVEALMARETQFADTGFVFKNTYDPQPVVQPKYPRENVDFEFDGSYAGYNWELFYHAPITVAARLTNDQKFEDALRWYHFIFDPTGGHAVDPVTGLPAVPPLAAPQKYWITKPFFQLQAPDYTKQRLDVLLNLLANESTPGVDADELDKLQHEVMDWRRNPFDPHLIAQQRIVAYQKYTVMKYIDNLLAWGDQRFRMDTLESVNEATQIYVVAAELLGPRPRRVPPVAKAAPQTFHELEKKLDDFSNALVDFENLIPAMPPGGGGPLPAAAVPSILYFCIPQNDKLLGYWDTVADRLYKIRHCLNIEGVFRQLPLFAPPIDPLALIKAFAAGLDINAALADLNAPLPNYRFSVTLQKANELAGDVRSLGSALIAALEKKDAEELARLRQSHEMALLNAVREVKKQQIDDAQLVIDGLTRSRELAEIRRDYYDGRALLNAAEGAALVLSNAGLVVQGIGIIANALAAVLHFIPDAKVGASGFGGSPHVTADLPTGEKPANASERAADSFSQISTVLERTGSIVSTLANYGRRKDDWDFQARLAKKEIEQIQKQIDSAMLKKTIAEKELANHDRQITNSKAVDDFLRTKFTNQELYQFMVGQLSQTYFQSYQLALDVAKRAERCYRFELGIENSSFVQPAYWDSLHKGLLAGERLQFDLRRLDSSYQERNRRELECTKHVSLAALNPDQLLLLKQNGRATFDVPEELYDLDYPGHYFRRIKSVSVTIPCVTGPNTTVNATLRLLRNSVRINSALPGGQYPHNQSDGVPTDDNRFRETHIGVTAIATSTAQNDSGLFELSFRDERYLPFECAGAISTWQLELMDDPNLRTFSYDTISDVILHIRYTAREDAGQFRTHARDHVGDVIKTAAASGAMPLRRLFDLKHEFPTQWHALLHPAPGSDATLQIRLSKQSFPQLAQPWKNIKVNAIGLVVRTNATAGFTAQLDSPDSQPITLASAPTKIHHGSVDNLDITINPTDDWTLQFPTSDAIEEAFLILQYTLTQT
jgi:hypothetical protein